MAEDTREDEDMGRGGDGGHAAAASSSRLPPPWRNAGAEMDVEPEEGWYSGPDHGPTTELASMD
eukprot:136578-Alexandrium_andersonii.AAC.1